MKFHVACILTKEHGNSNPKPGQVLYNISRFFVFTKNPLRIERVVSGMLKIEYDLNPEEKERLKLSTLQRKSEVRFVKVVSSLAS
jgi:hypothetical protein